MYVPVPPVPVPNEVMYVLANVDPPKICVPTATVPVIVVIVNVVPLIDAVVNVAVVVLFG